MKVYLSGIILFTGLLLTVACSSTSKSGESQVVHSQKSHMDSMNHGETGRKEQHENHKEKSTNIQTKVTAPKEIKPGNPTAFAIDIQDSAGKAINKFDTVQEKQMHLILVSDDLRFFNHIHPIYKGNGRFEVNPSFPNPGNYTMFSDYQPSGSSQEVSVQKVSIPGSSPVPLELEKFSNTKVLTDAKVNLSFSEPKLKASQELNLKFSIKDHTKNQPIKDLQPYLGEKAHLIIIKSSSPLKSSDYIHAHALKSSPDGEVDFMTSFPQPGIYKLWIQFNRNGKINTADFWVNVS
jgi:hypothetical protein